ncbi:MAG: sensor domain-containing diguanylate cyclase [Sulfurospirillaceae bacterium]|nr:sensor domain-containing diguanylate cyclase [Sulfurospirillaceae bacterium]
MLAKEMIGNFLNILPAVLYEYVFYNEKNSELLYITPSTLNILGHPPEYFMENLNRFWEMVHPDDIERILAENKKANKTNKLFVSEVRILHPSGQVRWVQLSSKPTSAKKHGSVIWVGYIIDITHIKEVEMELVKVNRKLQALSITDSLTNLANRRHFDNMLKNEWARFKRTQKPFSIIMLDIDFFKSYNDLYGHQMGDKCIKKIAKVLKKSTRRAGDLAARYGGEELVIIAFDTDIFEAKNMAESIRLSVEMLDIKHENVPLGKITVSLGVSTISDDEYQDKEHLLKAADMALYQAKKSERNCVRVAK